MYSKQILHEFSLPRCVGLSTNGADSRFVKHLKGGHERKNKPESSFVETFSGYYFVW